MANPKDIGKVFKEKLDGFNTTPSQLRWEDVESKLPKKEKRPLLYWISIGGVLVLVSLLFVLRYTAHTNTTIKKPNTTIDPCEELDFNNSAITHTSKRKNITEDPLNITNSRKDTTNTTQNRVSNTISNSSNDKNSSTTSHSSNPKSNASRFQLGNKTPNHSTSSNSHNTTKDTITSKKDVSHTDQSLINNTISSPLFSTSKNKNLADSIPIDSFLVAKTLTDSLDHESLVKKESITRGRKSKDTLLYLQPKKKILFQKFSIGVHLTPTYTFTPKGSLISDLIANTKNTGRVSLGYGILFKTYYSKKTALRIGYNRTKLSSVTKDILSNQIEIALIDAGISPPDNFIFEGGSALDLIQKITYTEISLGGQHQIMDQNIKTSILMGMNVLFLDSNTITIRDSSNKIKVGSARNLQKASFNLNIGANFQYPITKHIYLNTEPIFNFQLKDASNTTESYRHFFFTLQTGLSYKF